MPNLTSSINVNVPSNVKEEATNLFNSLGLNMSTAINMFLAQCIKTSSIPFIIAEPKPNSELIHALKEADYMVKHPEKFKSFNSVDELFEDLDND